MTTSPRSVDVAIIGAGPQGLATAAHLRRAGVSTWSFGETMGFWERHMPEGMLLRSAYRASSISDPRRASSLTRYQSASGTVLARPVPLADYIAYGHWFQEREVQGVDSRIVTQVDREGERYRLALRGDDVVHARRVVIAAGISLFGWRPPQFGGLPQDLVSHSVDHRDLARFAERRVLVVGGGQSALESAALLHESGAHVELVVRAWAIRWIGSEGTGHHGPVKQVAIFLLYPPTDVGPPGWNWVVATPDVYRLAPHGFQDLVVRRAIPPRAAAHLEPRLAGVRMTMGCNVRTVAAARGQVNVGLDDGTERRVDHVLLATGFRVDVARYPFLTPQILRSLRLRDGYPLLGPGLESSVPGLHFLGASAAGTFGPVMRFVSGSVYAARALTRSVLGKRQPPISFSF